MTKTTMAAALVLALGFSAATYAQTQSHQTASGAAVAQSDTRASNGLNLAEADSQPSNGQKLA